MPTNAVPKPCQVNSSKTHIKYVLFMHDCLLQRPGYPGSAGGPSQPGSASPNLCTTSSCIANARPLTAPYTWYRLWPLCLSASLCWAEGGFFDFSLSPSCPFHHHYSIASTTFFLLLIFSPFVCECNITHYHFDPRR